MTSESLRAGGEASIQQHLVEIIWHNGMIHVIII